MGPEGERPEAGWLGTEENVAHVRTEPFYPRCFSPRADPSSHPGPMCCQAGLRMSARRCMVRTERATTAGAGVCVLQCTGDAWLTLVLGGRSTWHPGTERVQLERNLPMYLGTCRLGFLLVSSWGPAAEPSWWPSLNQLAPRDIHRDSRRHIPNSSVDISQYCRLDVLHIMGGISRDIKTLSRDSS